MKVKHILETLHFLDDHDQVMITFFLKEHADEMVAENNEQPLTNDEWDSAVAKYERNDHIDQDACEAYTEAVKSVIKERVKK